MKKGIHPEYMETKVVCSCGNAIQTRSTKPELHIEICSTCHPFFTGKQKFVDTAGRVERFQKRYEKYQQKSKAVQKKENPVPAIVKVSQDKPKVKIEKTEKPVTATVQAEPESKDEKK